jgi:hypothetical protein
MGAAAVEMVEMLRQPRTPAAGALPAFRRVRRECPDLSRRHGAGAIPGAADEARRTWGGSRPTWRTRSAIRWRRSAMPPNCWRRKTRSAAPAPGRIIHDNTQRLNRLVTEVLELGRRDRAQPETLRWSRFLAGFMKNWPCTIQTAARVRIVVGGDDVELQFDRGHLYRILWNLMANALRHASVATARSASRRGPRPTNACSNCMSSMTARASMRLSAGRCSSPSSPPMARAPASGCILRASCARRAAPVSNCSTRAPEPISAFAPRAGYVAEDRKRSRRSVASQAVCWWSTTKRTFASCSI